MNDDRKFQERADIMKELFLAHIPADVIAEVVGVSSATVRNDRVRIAELYGIDIPNASASVSERGERFRLLLKTFLKVRFETHNRQDPLYEAARLIINFERIEDHLYTIESLFEKLENPRFISNNSVDKNYQQLIEHCISGDNYFPRKDYDFLREFYRAIHSGIIPIEEINNEQDIIELATKFCCDKDRSNINTTVIDNPKDLIDSLLPKLNEAQIAVIRSYYGLDGVKKDLNEIASEFDLSRERIRQIREKSLGIIRNELVEKKYLIHSTARYQHLEDQYNELNKKYNEYCKKTEDEIFFLKMENARLNGIFKENDIKLDQCNYPAYIKVLIEPIRGNYNLPCRLINCLYYDYDFIIDAVEDWDNLKYLRNFGKKTYIAFDEYLKSRGLDRLKLTFEERLLARQLIKRKKEINS